jgi:hypothetical protein
MKLQDFAKKIHDLIFEPKDTWGLALFRILLGLVILNKFIFLFADLTYWYTDFGVIDLKSSQHLTSGTRINLFNLLSSFDSVSVAYTLWSLAISSALMFCLGLWTRASALILFLTMVSFDHRNTLVLHGGDTLIRVLMFWMIFARSNAYYSIDKTIAIHKNKAPPPSQQSAWPLRALQIQVALMYLATFWHKTEGTAWWDGTAVYTVSQLIEFRRFTIPYLDSSWISIKAATWFTLVFEGSFAFFIWFRETRLLIIALGVIFHLCLEWHLNIPLFQWAAIASYAVFLKHDDLTRITRQVCRA